MTGSALDFACSRCAHRQAEDARCVGCGHDVVQDLRDSSGRGVLYEAESRWQRRRHARCTSLGVAVGILIFVPLCSVWMAVVEPRGVEAVLERPWKWPSAWVILLFIVGAAIAFFERQLAPGSRFPYLDEYEGRRRRSPYR
jgi:hypothetical protein